MLRMGGTKANPSGGEAALRMTMAEARGRFFVASLLRMTKNFKRLLRMTEISLPVRLNYGEGKVHLPWFGDDLEREGTLSFARLPHSLHGKGVSLLKADVEGPFFVLREEVGEEYGSHDRSVHQDPDLCRAGGIGQGAVNRDCAYSAEGRGIFQLSFPGPA